MIEPVVSAEWVRRRRDRVILADVRAYLDGRKGADAYARGHLPGAVFVDLDADLAAPPTSADGRHPLPDPAHFAERMSALGIGDDDTVIAYDDAGGVMAARLVWMLRALGQDAALLDGGLDAYGEKELETAVPERPVAARVTRPWPAERLAGLDDATSSDFVVIDARQPERFRGESEPIDPRPGHIPGARSVPCRENVDVGGRFLPPEVLRERFTAAGVTDGAEVVSYCGSGVTACHNLLALERAGFAPGRLYPGSWSQYSATDRPAATA
ncbi:sulfurtransferase [Actinoplanes bogorensis]|uniref:Sulfurtransferase n=1 Tax=Paractinoplanes bogorensis TaxID=1610840 RepID=A0ABS5Z0W6_9ACTN|nr:sulfurtransferase [Actinoplanes bogorensis]MBU2668614.1 sulfurtransferase [Actinoplanes bogorensis]